MQLEEIVEEQEEGVLEEIGAQTEGTNYAKVFSKIDSLYGSIEKEIKRKHKKLKKQLKQASENHKLLLDTKELSTVNKEFVDAWHSYLTDLCGDEKLAKKIGFSKAPNYSTISNEVYIKTIHKRLGTSDAITCEYIAQTTDLHRRYHTSLNHCPSDGAMWVHGLSWPTGVGAIGAGLFFLNPAAGIVAMCVGGLGAFSGLCTEGILPGYPFAQYFRKRKVKKAYKQELTRIKERVLREYK